MEDTLGGWTTQGAGTFVGLVATLAGFRLGDLFGIIDGIFVLRHLVLQLLNLGFEFSTVFALLSEELFALFLQLAPEFFTRPGISVLHALEQFRLGGEVIRPLLLGDRLGLLDLRRELRMSGVV